MRSEWKVKGKKRAWKGCRMNGRKGKKSKGKGTKEYQRERWDK